MKKLFLSTLLFITLFTAIGCYGDVDPEVEAKQKELSVSLDALQLQLGKILTNPDGIDKVAMNATLKQIGATQEAFNKLKDTGASWVDIAKGAVGGIFGRTLLHGLQVALLAYFPGPVGSGLSKLLGLTLGGSKSGKDKKT